MDTLFGLVAALTFGGLALAALGLFVFLVAVLMTAHWLTDRQPADALAVRVAAKHARRAAARPVAGDARTAPAQGAFAPARPGWSSVPPRRPT